MPELPEVETVARQLNEWLPGKRITGLKILDPKLSGLATDLHSISGSRIKRVFRTGKQVAVEVMAGRKPAWLLIHLRMTGRLFPRDTLVPEEKHTRFRLILGKAALDFVDTRRFGTADVHFEEHEIAPPGIDPFDSALTARRLLEMAAGSPGPIKAFLLRQDRITGLGNIYVCELLHLLGISPHASAKALSLKDWQRLIPQMRRILNKAIELCGTTFRDFQDSRGTEGGFGRMLKVYGREGQRCKRCDGTVIREEIAQRGTFWCPGCQSDRG